MLTASQNLIMKMLRLPELFIDCDVIFIRKLFLEFLLSPLYTMQQVACNFVASCTLSGQKYFNITKYPCIDCAINRLSIQLGAKMGIEIYRYQSLLC